MHVTLEPHPHSVAPALRVEAEAKRDESGLLRLSYRVSGDIDAILLPAPALPAPAPTDGLWNHTCFEAFVRTRDEAGYVEFNLAPSGQWAAYRFEDYRSGRSNLAGAPPEITARFDGSRYELAASVALAQAGIADRLWLMALTAVIESRDHDISYWSVAHGPGRPDFHHPDCFALELRPPKDA